MMTILLTKSVLIMKRILTRNRECRRINEAWLKDVMITILHEFMHIANWKIPDHEVYRTSEQFAKQYIQKNNIVKSTIKTAYR